MDNLEKVFEDTVSLFSSDETLKKSCELTRKNQKFYDESIVFPEKTQFEGETEIIVSKKSSFEAASFYSREGKKTCVLNFANSFNPGGGVVYGARAQEECLCRVSTLYFALCAPEMLSHFYEKHRETFDDLGTDDIIYSPCVTVFKGDSDLTLMKKSDWFSVDVLTCAAPDLNDVDLSGDEIFALHEKRWSKILSVAKENGVDSLVLGAFGCGAFRNPPQIVAQAAKKALKKYRGAFKTIEFAIKCVRDKDSANYEAFKNAFSAQ